jgi:pimeloyl-ACP methyl ester carboxylesterase
MLHHPESADDLAVFLQARNGPRGKITKFSDLVLPDKLLAPIARMEAQVDAVWGEHDRPHPDPALQAAALRRLRPDAELRVVPDAGHWAMYERADAFNRILVEMLAQPLRALDARA